MTPIKVLLGALLLCYTRPLTAQIASATISGGVKDSTGAAVATAQVTVTNEATGISRAMKTNDAGLYVIPGLAIGTYRVEVEASGFK